MELKPEKGESVGRYTILDPNLGKGATGPVCLAGGTSGNSCVIKFLARSDDERYKAFFRAEFQKLTELDHPNIAKATDFGEHSGLLYLVTEFIDGKNLYEATYHLSPEDSVPLFLKALDGLDYIHKNGFIHLDIKPENILVRNADGEVKIIDMGTATSVAEFKNLSQGTVPFMAPEIVLSWDKEVNARADLFSLGATAYYCLTRGKLPFIFRNKTITKAGVDYDKLKKLVESECLPPPPSESRRDLPEYLDTIISRLLAKRPEARIYSSARAVMYALNLRRPETTEDAAVNTAYLKPLGNRHVGREKEQGKLQKALDELVALRQPLIGFFCIQGENGLGKTHLINKLYQSAVIYPDKVFVSLLSCPANAETVGLWSQTLIQELLQDKRAVLILVDDADEGLPAEISDTINGVIGTLNDRLGNVASAPEKKPIMLCYAAQNALPVLQADLMETIELKPFSKIEVENYLKETPAFLNKTVPKNWIEKLHKETNGNPNELAEHLQYLENRGLLFDLNGDIKVAATEVPVSQTTEKRLLRQYSGLSPVEREIANLLAVWTWRGITRPITYEDVSNFIYSTQLNHCLGLLENKGIVSQLAFSSPKTADLAYRQIEEKDREIMHDLIADYLKKDADGIALHRAYGRNKEKFLKTAAKLGIKRLFEFGEAKLALDIFRDALRLTRHAGPKISIYIRTLLIDAYYYDGRYDIVLRIFKAAKAPGKLWRQKLILKVLPSLIELKQYKEASTLLEEAKKIYGGLVNPLSIRLRNMEGALLYKMAYENPSDTEKLLKQAREIYEKTGRLAQSLPAGNLVANNELGTVLRLMGESSLAVVKLRDKLAAMKDCRNLFEEFLTVYSLAEASRFAGYYNDARKYCVRLFELAQKGRKNSWLLHAHDLMANYYYDTKEFGKSIEEGNRCLIIVRFVKKGCNEIYKRLLIRMGCCYKELKKYNEAVVHLEGVISHGADGIYAMAAYAGLADIYCLTGDRDRAALLLQKAEKFVATIPPALAERYLIEIKRIKDDICQNKKTGKS